MRVVGGADHLGQVPGAEPVLDLQVGAAERLVQAPAGGGPGPRPRRGRRRPPPAPGARARRASIVNARYASRRVVVSVAVASSSSATLTGQVRRAGGQVGGVPGAQRRPGLGHQPLQGLDPDQRAALGAQGGQQRAPPGHPLVPAGGVGQADAGEADPGDGRPRALVTVLDDRQVTRRRPGPTGSAAGRGCRAGQAAPSRLRGTAAGREGRGERAAGEPVLPAAADQQLGDQPAAHSSPVRPATRTRAAAARTAAAGHSRTAARMSGHRDRDDRGQDGAAEHGRLRRR